LERVWLNLTINVSGEKPSPRVFHGLALSGDSLLYVFGGKQVGGKNQIASPIQKGLEYDGGA